MAQDHIVLREFRNAVFLGFGEMDGSRGSLTVVRS